MKPRFSLSTCWCSHRHTDGYEMIKEMAGLGFSRVELSHGIRISLVPGILRAAEEGLVEFGSTHNFCPLPPGIMHAAPNIFEPSSPHESERSQWLRYTKRSLDLAKQLGAKVLVCHLGSAKFLWANPETRLERYLDAHPERPAADPAYEKVLAKCVKRLRSKMDRYLVNTKASINAVLDYAAKQGVVLGFENREGFVELPIDADYADFMAAFPADAPIGYWHDTGHAQIKHNQGLLDHRGHLEKMAGRLIGFHLHDVNAEGSDHQTIGSGMVDFKMVSSFWRPEQTLVLELSPRLSVDDVLRSKERVEALLA